jgi:hypothetical protein
MVEDNDGAGRSANQLKKGRMRRPYVKPFVRNLDASETEGKPLSEAEFTNATGTRVGTAS